MLRHECKIEEQVIIGQRPNPLNPAWCEWTLVACPRCKAVQEWQHHSEEQMHGGDLQITAAATEQYIAHAYHLSAADIGLLLDGKKAIRRYNRYTGLYEESYCAA